METSEPLAELASRLQYDDLIKDCSAVLRTLNGKEAEIHAQDDAQYLMRISPYRTSNNVIDGLVLTFVEIRARLALSESIVATLREPIVLLDEQQRLVSCNDAFYRLFNTNERQTIGHSIYELGAAQWDVAELRRLLEEILPQNSSFENFRVSAEFARLGRRTFALNARRLHREPGLRGMILLAIEDVTPDVGVVPPKSES